MLSSKYKSNKDLRKELYEGSVFLLDPLQASLNLVQETKKLLIEFFGEDYRASRHSQDNGEFFAKISELRRIIYLDPRFHKLISQLVVSYGFNPDKCLMDPARLRVITHEGHNNPKAKPVYYAHRDTWYAHSQSLITWWIPLDDLIEEETFEFFPDYFNKEVSNDSEIFNYDDWIKEGWDLKIGWQKEQDGIEAQFPSLTGDFDRRKKYGFSCKSGQNLLFSGAQFHQTKAQSLKRNRFSLDFRLVVLSDHDLNWGAPNVDNRSKGSTIIDYFPVKC